MSMFGRCWVAIFALLGILFLAGSGLAATPMPEFGKSVQFDNSGPDISISKLKGKAVLVIFFQSWCPIANGWSPSLIKQVQEAHGNSRELVLIAIKTDGGGVAGAKEYLTSRNADMDKWFVGSDEKAAYYQTVRGKDDLWGYALVDGKGEIVRQGQAGMFWTDGPDKDKCVLADKDLLKDCGKLETVLPNDKEYPADLGKVVRLAEMGALGKALALCASGGTRSKNATAKNALRQDLLAVAEKRLRGQMDILKDAGQDGGSRYTAYQELTGLVKELGALPTAKEATSLLTKAASDPVIQREKGAETAYLTTLYRMEKASARDRPRRIKELELVAKKYEGTKYGHLAAIASQKGENAQ